MGLVSSQQSEQKGCDSDIVIVRALVLGLAPTKPHGEKGRVVLVWVWWWKKSGWGGGIESGLVDPRCLVKPFGGTPEDNSEEGADRWHSKSEYRELPADLRVGVKVRWDETRAERDRRGGRASPLKARVVLRRFDLSLPLDPFCLKPVR